MNSLEKEPGNHIVMETQRKMGGEKRQHSENVSSGEDSPEKLNQQEKKQTKIYVYGYGCICGEREIYFKDLAPS